MSESPTSGRASSPAIPSSSSSFDVQSPGPLSKPQPVHLASSSSTLNRRSSQCQTSPAGRDDATRLGLPKRSPSYLEAFSRSTVPSSSVTDYTAKYPDILTPRTERTVPLGLETVASDGPASPRRPGQRSRSASVSSLKSLLERQSSSGTGEGLSRINSRDGPKSPSRRASYAASSRAGSLNKPLPPIEDGESSSGWPGLDLLSWNPKLWKVTPPETLKAKGKSTADRAMPADDDGAGLDRPQEQRHSHDSDRSWLSLFGGKRAADEAHAHQEAQRAQDAAEEELLDADLESLSRAARGIQIAAGVDTPTRYRDADEGSPAPGRRSPDKTSSFGKNQERDPASTSPSKAFSFLPTSIFSSASGVANGSSLEGPASMFASLSIPNPFNGAASTPAPRTHRRYSTSRGKKDGENGEPTARRKDVEQYLDEEDTETAKQEDKSDMEVFSMIKDRYRCPKYPLVFCHGLFGFDMIGPASIKPLQFSYWVGVKEALEAMGAEVLIGRVPASASIEERAKVLCELIERTYAGREINLIGHSMGGLDGRFLISRLQPTTFKVRSLTTISTPHRGSSFADYMLEDVLGPSRVPALLSLMETLGVPGGGKAFDDLTVTRMARFNEETIDSADVKYFSYGAEFEPSWSNVFRVPWGIIHEREGPNDGLVSVKSAQWGSYQATLSRVNHLDMIGWSKVRYSWDSLVGNPIKFKPISFFCAVAEMLADEGL